MEWSLDFISEEDFKNHVRATIMKYGEKLESYDLKRFNTINEQIQNIAQKKDTLCRRMYN
jgi:hypothetical protein